MLRFFCCVRSLRLVKKAALLMLLFAASALDCPPNGGTPGSGFPRTVAWTQTVVNDDAGARPSAIVAADFDGDDLTDLAVGHQGFEAEPARIVLLFRQEDDTFSPVAIIEGESIAGVAALAAADLNGDDRPDLVAACAGRLAYLPAPEEPRQADQWAGFEIDESIAGEGIGQWNDVAIANIDGVNGPDIVACGQDVGRLSWFASPSEAIATGTGWQRIDIDAETREGASSILVVDVNGDGKIDVFSTAPGEESARIAWYQNPSNPVTEPWTKFTIGNLPAATRIAIGDLNVDSRPDVVVLNPPGRQIGWYMRPANPADAWTGFLLTQYGTATPVDIGVADTDGNSQPDVVVASRTPGSLRWFTPVGTQTDQWIENNLFDLPQNVNMGRFVLEDFDGDNRRDVIGCALGENTADDSVLRWENPE
ncbi:MAG TPA: VCBS repeat-containing protein [Phycisphaerae bacterium]|nr:VCBS repeat-containing protein [Phycisphaerae bacterium]